MVTALGALLDTALSSLSLRVSAPLRFEMLLSFSLRALRASVASVAAMLPRDVIRSRSADRMSETIPDDLILRTRRFILAAERTFVDLRRTRYVSRSL